MRILMTTETVGGVWTYALELARALQYQDVEIALATIGGPLDAWQREQVSQCRNLTLYESSFRLEWMNDPGSDVEKAGQWLLELEALYEPDVVHLNGYAFGTRPFDAPVLMVGHSCVLSWFRAVKGQPAPSHWELYRQAVMRGLRGADLVVAPSADMLAALDRHYGPLARTQVIHHGRNPGRYAPGVKQELILAAGRTWDEAKNLAAIEFIAPELPWLVQIAGEGRPSDTPNIQWLGRIDEQSLAYRMSVASIFTMPALYEPFGLSILEAAMSGCALVLGDIPSLREIWGETAIFVQPDDLSAIRGAIQRLIDSPTDRQRLGDAVRERSQRYSSTATAKAYLNAYRQLREDAWRSVEQAAAPAQQAPATSRASVFSQQPIA